MSINFLLKNIGKANIAEGLDEDVLIKIGARVKRQFYEDLGSMDDWLNAVENGIELMKQEYEGKSYPWEGASNYKDPILTEAATIFGDKASLELLRAKDLIAYEVVGRDPEGEKKKRAERVVEAMNFQLNHDMKVWREQQERLFYNLPVVGVAFKMPIYDPVDKSCDSVIIRYPDFAVNQATESMDRCRSFSRILVFSTNEILERVNCGKWLDPFPEQNNSPKDQEGDAHSNESEQVVNSIDNPGRFIEQHTFYDLDGDGYEEPYIITICESSRRVVRILPRYDEYSIFVEYQDEYMPVSDVIRTEERLREQEFGGAEAIKLLGLTLPDIDADKFKLIKIDPFNNIVKYGFIPAPDNTFLDLGYSHLLGALTQGLNVTTNQINDRNTLNILGGGFLAKEFRLKQGFQRFRMGEYKQTEVPAEKLAKGIFPQPLQEPSQVGLEMRNVMQERAKGFLATVDISGKLQATTAPTTALAIIQEAIIPTTALFKRILSSLSKELQVLYRINRRTFPAKKYKEILDDPQADPIADFNFSAFDIIPTANAEMSSKMHRIQTSQLEMETLPLVLQAGGNPVPILKGFYEAIGSDKVDRIFPPDGQMSPEDQKVQQQMLAEQKRQADAAQLQAQILAREQDRLDAETRIKLRKAQPEIDKLLAEIQKIIADAQKAKADAGEASNITKREDMRVMSELEMKRAEVAANLTAKEREDRRKDELHLDERTKRELDRILAQAKVDSERLSQQQAMRKQELVEEDAAAKRAERAAAPKKVAVKKPRVKKNG